MACFRFAENCNKKNEEKKENREKTSTDIVIRWLTMSEYNFRISTNKKA